MGLDFPCGSGPEAGVGGEVVQAVPSFVAAPAPCAVPQLCMPGPVRRRKGVKVSSARVFNGESEGRGLFTNMFGVPSTTPARPLPASVRGRRRVFKGVTKDWREVYAKPSSSFKDAGSRFRGARKSKRVTWGQWKHPASPPRECVSKVKGTPRKPRSARSGIDGDGSSGPSLLEVLGIMKIVKKCVAVCKFKVSAG